MTVDRLVVVAGAVAVVVLGLSAVWVVAYLLNFLIIATISSYLVFFLVFCCMYLLFKVTIGVGVAVAVLGLPYVMGW